MTHSLSTASGQAIEIKSPSFDPRSQRVLIIAAEANDLVVSRLLEAAIKSLVKASVLISHIEVMRVPGALEIPLALNQAAHINRFNAYVVLGAVIKGKTDHYDHVCRLANDGVLQTALKYRLPLGNGILTVHSLEHALERADGPAGNLGRDAALAALTMCHNFAALNDLVRGQ